MLKNELNLDEIKSLFEELGDERISGVVDELISEVRRLKGLEGRLMVILKNYRESMEGVDKK